MRWSKRCSKAAFLTRPGRSGWRGTCSRVAGRSRSPARTARPRHRASLAWILEHAGLDPGFLIGGVPGNFNVTARLGSGQHFVVEADEYDTAFFDNGAQVRSLPPAHRGAQQSRARPRRYLSRRRSDPVAVPSADAHGPAQRSVVANAGDANVMRVIDMGCWTPVERFAGTVSSDTAWYAAAPPGGDYSAFTIMEGNRRVADVQWQMLGRHNAGERARRCARRASRGCRDRNCGRSFERISAACVGGWKCAAWSAASPCYDDFAHHPTAIDVTIDALRRRIGQLTTGRSARAALEHDEARHASRRDAKSLERADRVWLNQGRM